jgi:hypothetical protein
MEVQNKLKDLELLFQNLRIEDDEYDSDEDPDPIAYWDEDMPVYQREINRKQKMNRLDEFLKNN